MAELLLVEEYRCTENRVPNATTGRVEQKFVKDPKGSCLTLEYTVNGNPVRFVMVSMPINTRKRQFAAHWMKQIQNELGEWEAAEGGLNLVADDSKYVDSSNGESVTEDVATEMVNGEEILNGGQSFSPKKYKQIKQIKDGYETEAEYLLRVNSSFLNIVNDKGKAAVERLYDSGE